MKLLFDQNISFRLVKKIADLYSDAKHVKGLGIENKSDPEIWSFAKRHGFTIVTFNEDFYELSIVQGSPPKIIWLRTGNTSTGDLEVILIKNHDLIDAFMSNENYKELSCLEID